MEKKFQRFYQFRGDKIINTFGIRIVEECAILNDWMGAEGVLSDFENMTIDLALDRYAQLGKSWNEEELKMHFISAIISVANPNIPHVCKTYFERPLEGTVGNLRMNVITDCMIASPRLAGDPGKPYFFLQEFKQSQHYGKTDPQGQMLAAMLLSQQINADDKPLYGCYVVENNWRFTTLVNLDYCISQQFDSRKKAELVQIVLILRKIKELILNR